MKAKDVIESFNKYFKGFVNAKDFIAPEFASCEFDYLCSNCGADIYGSPGKDITCPQCGKTWETGWTLVDLRHGHYAGFIKREVPATNSVSRLFILLCRKLWIDRIVKWMARKLG